MEMGDIYRESLAEHLTWSAQTASHPSESPRSADDSQRRMSNSVMHLVEHIHESPVLLVPTTAGRLEGASVFQQASVWGSILPAVWNLMLALRLEGLGSAWTTLHLYREREMADLLGIPYERHTQAGLFPIAYTRGVDFGRADRSKSEAAIRWNGW